MNGETRVSELEGVSQRERETVPQASALPELPSTRLWLIGCPLPRSSPDSLIARVRFRMELGPGVREIKLSSREKYATPSLSANTFPRSPTCAPSVPRYTLHSCSCNKATYVSLPLRLAAVIAGRRVQVWTD